MQFLEDFLNNMTSEHTRLAYNNDIRKFLEFINNRCLSKVELKDLVEYRDLLKKQGYSSASVNRKISSLRSLLSWMYANEIMDKNPTTGLKLPRIIVKNPTQAFTDLEVRNILALTKPARDQLILELFLTTGIRRSELLGLSKSDVYEVGSHTVIKVEGKGGKFRELPLKDDLKDKLLEYSGNLSTSKLFNIDESTIFRIVKKYAKKAGVNKRVSPHSCRATAITKALENGAVITDVADYAGHSSIMTTQVYWKRRRGLEESPAYKVDY